MTPATVEGEFTHEEINVLDGLTRVVRLQLQGRVRHFSLVLHKAGLVLHGLSATYYAKQLAQHVLMQATQLPILANAIEVAMHSCDPDDFPC